MDNDIVWIKITYKDNSEVIFRGTRNINIIKDCVNSLPNLDVYKNNVLQDGYIFNVKEKRMVLVDAECIVEEFKTKPKYDRRIDKFAASFI